ncbi:MAG TPA: alpha/beta fold hydrolase, partial [Polyangiaceae bacterium]|nr:alpha/beta fold hydrolase [Polyangiaceae bacterium]
MSDASGAAPGGETHYASSGDVSIAYQVTGEGPVDLLFVPGIASHVEAFHALPGYTRLLSMLGRFARVITFDKRGNGLSDRVAEAPSLYERIDDVRAVLDAVGSRRTALFGLSEGGAMSILFAAEHPERTTALVLFGSLARALAAPGYDAGFPPAAYEAFCAGVVQAWGTGGPLTHFFGPSLAGDEAVRAAAARCERASATPTTLRQLWRMYGSIDVREALGRVRAPTLVMHRAGDRVVPVAASRYIAAHIPGARLVELEGENHFPFVGDVDAVVAAVAAALGAEPAAPPGARPAALAAPPPAALAATRLAAPAAPAAARPAAPARPGQPGQPGQADRPDSPERPNRPGQPGQPDQPSRPGRLGRADADDVSDFSDLAALLDDSSSGDRAPTEPLERDDLAPSELAQLVARANRDDFEAPLELERFVVLRPLGSGGMGAVFLARDRDLDRPVALKVLHTRDLAALRRFRREATAVARLSHPNVVQLYELGLDAAAPYLVMEYAAGGPLSQACRGPTPWPRAARLVLGAARGLGAAHAVGVVHRDVKPANLLLAAPDGDAVKVADFGLAKLAGAEPLTREGSVLGTVGYLSPEQAGGEPVDARADVYGLGVVFFRLLCGRPPFTGTPSEILARTLTTPRLDPSPFAPGLP